jgi:hypothetical protein
MLGPTRSKEESHSPKENQTSLIATPRVCEFHPQYLILGKYGKKLLQQNAKYSPI